MAKELPYFRFTVQDWQNGKVTLESYEVQGLFINVCGYYWINDCNLTLTMLKKKFSNATILLEQLVELDIIKHENRHDKVEIDFLNVQYDLLSEKRKHRQAAGSKGGNAKAKRKQKDSYKDKDNNKDKDKIENRKLKFADTLKPFLETYGKVLLNDFYKYWTEPNKSNTKFKQELQQTWDLERRLSKWAENDKSFKKPTIEEPTKKKNQPA